MGIEYAKADELQRIEKANVQYRDDTFSARNWYYDVYLSTPQDYILDYPTAYTHIYTLTLKPKNRENVLLFENDIKIYDNKELNDTDNEVILNLTVENDDKFSVNDESMKVKVEQHLDKQTGIFTADFYMNSNMYYDYKTDTVRFGNDPNLGPTKQLPLTFYDTENKNRMFKFTFWLKIDNIVYELKYANLISYSYPLIGEEGKFNFEYVTYD